jgi:hypothetical protein
LENKREREREREIKTSPPFLPLRHTIQKKSPQFVNQSKTIPISLFLGFQKIKK